jgi:hypothetical protein
MTLKGVDSWWMPNTAQLVSAKANGIQAWAGYFSNGNDGIYGGGWSDAVFFAVMAAGLHTLAFCSTRADPVAWKARAAKLGIVIVADVESSVDGGDGPQVDPWLAASGARLYGGGPRGDGTITRHLKHGHAGYMLADYEAGLPGWGTASWPAGDLKPNAPCAWQFQGGAAHPFGNTDLGIYDESFIGIAPAPPEEDMAWVLYKVTGGDATEWCFTGANTFPCWDAAVLVANGNLKSPTPAMVSQSQHKAWVALTTPAPVTTGGTVPVNAVLTGTLSGTLKG